MAITPVVWVGTLWSVVGWTPPMWTLLSLLVLVGYLGAAAVRSRAP